MGWGNLRVINEDRIAPGTGFGTHGHRDMEIISYVLSGELAHKDSMGHVKSIPPGDVQRMSAGRGVMHSEFNHAPNDQTHFLQIWILPNQRGIEPGYEQKTVPESAKRGRLALVASPGGGEHAVRIHADARLWAGLFDGDQQARLDVPVGRWPTFTWFEASCASTVMGYRLGMPCSCATSHRCKWMRAMMLKCWSLICPNEFCV